MLSKQPSSLPRKSCLYWSRILETTTWMSSSRTLCLGLK